ncbi:MAG: hypothetical protein ACOX5Z_10335 [Desulfobulbus sp.]|jgi:hypothetical protein
MEDRALSELTSSQRKSVYALQQNIERFVAQYGRAHVGLLTLTFPDEPTEREVAKRLNSLMSNWLKSQTLERCCVKELTKAGSWHLHIVASFKLPLFRGFRWQKDEHGRKTIPVYRSASRALRSFWKQLKEILPRFGFGRSELLPARSGKALGRYLAKVYWQKARNPEAFKGVRLVSWSRGFIRSSSRFSWNTVRTREWRRKVARFACELLQIELASAPSEPSLSWLNWLYPNWAWKHGDTVRNIDVILARPDWVTHYRRAIKPIEF